MPTKRTHRRPQAADAPRDERKLVGKVLGGKFHVRGLIGSGGVGNVYEAIDRTMRRTVAIKVPGRGTSETVIKRFLREGRAGASIAHPNVCALYDVGPLEDGIPFLVMERLFGETLADLLEREGRLSLFHAAVILSQVAAGLGAAHAGGIIHRDMKPENVFLCRPAGGESIVKILDFGASKLDRFSAPRVDDLEDLTATGFAVGTPYYMSPEQCRGERLLDGRVDIFACGTMLYEALTGVRPFEGKNLQQVFARIVAADYVPASHLVPEIPAAVDDVLRHALARAPEDRYPSVEAFGRAVEALKTLDPAAAHAMEEPSTERLAYLRQRFHELAVLYRTTGASGRRKGASGGGGAGASRKSSARSQSSVEIPVFFDDPSLGTPTPPAVEAMAAEARATPVPSSDTETAPRAPKRRS